MPPWRDVHGVPPLVDGQLRQVVPRRVCHCAAVALDLAVQQDGRPGHLVRAHVYGGQVGPAVGVPGRPVPALGRVADPPHVGHMDLTGRVVYPKVGYARVGPVEPYVLYERVAVLIAVVDAQVRVVVVGRCRVRRVGHVDVARHGILLDYRRLYVPHVERARNVVDAVAVGAGLAVRMVGALRVRFARRANGRGRCRHEQRGDRQHGKQASRPGGPPRVGAMRHPPPVVSARDMLPARESMIIKVTWGRVQNRWAVPAVRAAWPEGRPGTRSARARPPPCAPWS